MLQIVILAAGKGSRMQSDLPKVLHLLHGRPLLSYVLQTARALSPDRIIVVVGHRAQMVRDAFPDGDIHWAHQSEQLGTGHAVLSAREQMLTTGKTLIMLGDTPLIRDSSLRSLQEGADTPASILVSDIEDPTGYGRIVTDASGNFLKVAEHKDASEDEKKIRTVNTGIMLFDSVFLLSALTRLRPDNAQKEYYLTDVPALALADGYAVRIRSTHSADEVK